MHLITTARARAGITGFTAALAMFGFLSSPIGSIPASRALAQPLDASVGTGSSAPVPQAPYPFKEVDSVLILGDGYDVGGDGFTNGAPDGPASLTWTQNWFGLTPQLTGKIHFNNAEKCARVKLISYDSAGAQVGDPDYSDNSCPNDKAHYGKDIKSGGNSGVLGNIGAASLKVILQTLNTDGSWNNVGNQTVTFGPVLDTDNVQILTQYADLGSGTTDGTKPSGSATLTWNATGGIINPRLAGTLFITDSRGLCFHMKATYKDHDGNPLDVPRIGDEHCLDDSLSSHTYPVNMSSFSSGAVFEVTYAIEEKDASGVYESVGETTVQLGDPTFIPSLP